MAASGAHGYGVPIVQVTESRRFVLDEQALAGVLLREDTRHLPVVLVSVAGAYRGGKSFLLNFFLRYLTAPQSARDDGSWLLNGDTLEGFSWRGGSERNTTGIQMWSEPFICQTATGSKVAVLLMDTQGTFDSSSTMEDCTNIFALSTLLCSVQIYNLSQKIQEDHLQHLHLFTEYGRLTRDQGQGRAFQTLMFLVRDWQNPYEFQYGTAGGNSYLQAQLQVNSGSAEEIRAVRNHIRSCFDKVSCFLMPHPGLTVCNPHFRGELNQLADEFKQYVKYLVDSIFKTVNLTPRIVNGKTITSNELYTYFKSYMSIFSSGRMPSMKSIMQVTTEANLLSAIRELAGQYEFEMERECGENTPCIPPADLKVLHDRYKKTALENYKTMKLMGPRDTIKTFQEKLSKDIDDRAEKYAAVNAVKRQAVIDAAKQAYDAKVRQYSPEDAICVHPDDIESIHSMASSAAMGTFDSLVRRITDKKDAERDIFLRRLTNEHDLLKNTNERSNTQLESDLRIMYWEHMQPSILADPLPFPAQLRQAHDEGYARVMDNFNRRRRCLAHSYPTDVYKDRIISTMNNYYNDVRIMNESANGRAMNAAVTEYSGHVNRHWNLRTENLHPDELAEIHVGARAAALAILLGNRRREQDIPQEDRTNLERMMSTRYTEFEHTNAAANREAVQSAYNLFISSLEEQRRARWYWIFIVPIIATAIVDLQGTYFKHSKKLAIDEFYKNRKRKGLESTDTYFQELLTKINKHDPWKLVERGIDFCRQYIKDHFGFDL